MYNIFLIILPYSVIVSYYVLYDIIICFFLEVAPVCVISKYPNIGNNTVADPGFVKREGRESKRRDAAPGLKSRSGGGGGGGGGSDTFSFVVATFT